MNISTVWQHPTLPIMLRRYTLAEALDTDSAQLELEALIEEKSDGQSSTWGYFPELAPELKDFPETIALEKKFYKIIEKDQLLHDKKLKLAFVRRATKEPQSNFGGLHIDVSAGIDHKWDSKQPSQSHILRTLFNLGNTNRILNYYPHTIEQLAKEGVVIPRDHYEMLKLPPRFISENLEIPALSGTVIYGLVFISSLIPHAGLTTQDGHFLISYGGYINEDAIRQLFEARGFDK